MPNKRIRLAFLGVFLTLATVALPASRVISPAAEMRELSARWQWALQKSAGYQGTGSGFIGYAIVMKEKHHCRCGARKPGRNLRSLLGLPGEEEGKNRTFFLFRYPSAKSVKGGGFAKLTLADADSVIHTGEAPFYYLGTFSMAESFGHIKSLFAKSHDPAQAKELLLAAAIHSNSDAVVPFLISVAKKHEDLEIRKKAVFWLGLHPTTEAVQYLEKILKANPAKGTGKQAMASLGLNRHARATAVLLDQAENGREESIRNEALFWLSTKVRKKILPAGDHDGGNDEAMNTALSALTALAQIDRASVGAKLASLAQSNLHPRVKARALFWLTQRGDARSLPIVKRLLERPDSSCL